MKRVYVLVEGPSDAAFLRRILPREVLTDAELVPAGGRSAIASLARSLVVRRRTPIAVVIDSDSLKPDVIEERQQGMQELIRAAGNSVPIKVVSAVPEIEAWFFAAPGTIERLVGQKVPPDWLSLGKRDPHGVLQQLAENNNRSWNIDEAINALDEHDVERIRAVPAVADLSRFLQEVQEQAGREAQTLGSASP